MDLLVFLMWILGSFTSLVIAVENNVCATYRDYNYPKENPNCWHNFAAEATVVRIYYFITLN